MNPFVSAVLCSLIGCAVMTAAWAGLSVYATYRRETADGLAFAADGFDEHVRTALHVAAESCRWSPLDDAQLRRWMDAS